MINDKEVMHFNKPMLFEHELAQLDPGYWLDTTILDKCLDFLRERLKNTNRNIDIVEPGWGNDLYQKACVENIEYLILPYQERFKNPIMYMPINVNSSHWILAVIDNKKHTINVYDSLHNKNYKEIKNLKQAITKIVNYKKPKKAPKIKPYDDEYINDCPKQLDCNSCGIFVYKNIECQIFNKGKYDYSQKDMKTIRAELKKKLIDKMKAKGQKITNARDFELISLARWMRDRILSYKGLKEKHQKLE